MTQRKRTRPWSITERSPTDVVNTARPGSVTQARTVSTSPGMTGGEKRPSMSRQLRVGTVWINAYRTVNWSMPFGGVKHSGHGREKGIEALSGFLVDPAVWVETTGATRDPFVLG